MWLQEKKHRFQDICVSRLIMERSLEAPTTCYSGKRKQMSCWSDVAQLQNVHTSHAIAIVLKLQLWVWFAILHQFSLCNGCKHRPGGTSCKTQLIKAKDPSLQPFAIFKSHCFKWIQMNLSSSLQSSPGNNNNSETSWAHEWSDVSIYCATNLVVRWPRPPRLGGSAPSSCSPHSCSHVSTMMTTHFFSLLLTYYPIIHWAQRGSSLRPLLLYFYFLFFLFNLYFFSSLVFGHLLKASRHAEEATRLPETQPAPACTAACKCPRYRCLNTASANRAFFFYYYFNGGGISP